MTREQQILEAFRQKPKLTTRELQEITGLNTVFYVIGNLRKKGHVIYTVQKSIQCYYQYISDGKNRSEQQ
jgi:hypothetical protein